MRRMISNEYPGKDWMKRMIVNEYPWIGFESVGWYFLNIQDKDWMSMTIDNEYPR